MLEIQTVKPELNYDVKHAELLMQTKQPDLNMSTTPGQFEAETVPAVVDIDTSESRDYLGIGSIFDMAQMQAEAGKQQVINYIAKKAEQGDRLADLKDKKSTVAEIAGENALDYYDSNGLTDLDYPLEPKFDVTGGTLNENYTPGKFDMNPTIYPVDMQYVPWSFNIEVTRYPEIHIQYVGNNIDYKI